MISIHDIEECIVNNDVNCLEQYVDQIVENKYQDFYSILAKGLMETKNPRIRNKLALALSDVRYEGVEEKIIELLKSDSTKGCRGTLLYALEPLNYIDQIEFIFKLLKDDSFKTRWQAYNLIKIACDNIPPEAKNRMIDIAQEAVNMYQDVLELLE